MTTEEGETAGLASRFLPGPWVPVLRSTLVLSLLACTDQEPGAPAAAADPAGPIRAFHAAPPPPGLVPLVLLEETGAQARTRGVTFPPARLARQVVIREPGPHRLSWQTNGATGGRLLVVALREALPEPLSEDSAKGLAVRTAGVLLDVALDETVDEGSTASGEREFVVRGDVPALLLGLEAAPDQDLRLDRWSLTADLVAGPRTFTVGQEARQARVLGTGDTLRIPVPAQAATALQGWSAHLAVAAHPASGNLTLELADGRIDVTPEAWVSHEVQLGPEEQEIWFRVPGEPRTGAALVAEPLFLPPASAGPRGPSVVLISLDTLRADHLGSYGDPRGLTPHLDALAAEGFRFEQARSPSNFTLPGHAGLLTGRSPYGLAVGHPEALGSIHDVPGLAGRLAAAGYLCVAFTGGGYVNPMFGMARGFDRFGLADPLLPWSEDFDPADTPRLRQVLDWITRHRDRPFFLFLHTYHVHEYLPSEDAAARFVDEAHRDYERRPPTPQERRQLRESATEEQLEGLRQRYAATVADADRMVGRVLQHLEEQGLAEDCLVVVTSDHGESFGEQGRVFHSAGLHDAVLRVPLILRGPGVPRGEEDRPVSLEDVAPTLLDLLELPPLPATEGRSLRRLFPGGVSHRPTTAHDFRVGAVDHALVVPRYTLVQHAAGADSPVRWDLYDRDQADGGGAPVEDGPVRDRLRAMLGSLLESLDRARVGRGDGSPSLPPELAAQLQALGYAVR